MWPFKKSEKTKVVDKKDFNTQKRRFKTAEELVANRYGIVSFNAYGVVEVVQSGATLRRTKSDTPEGNYSKDWLDVFTCAEEEA